MFRGTQVGDGVGQMIVSNVGDDTMLGQIARRLGGELGVTVATGVFGARMEVELANDGPVTIMLDSPGT